MPANTKSPLGDYALASDDRERRRLMLQGAILREHLEKPFRASGIGPGMRVLDIGSGVGDVAFLAADLIGPHGSVVGVDRDRRTSLGLHDERMKLAVLMLNS